MNTNIKLLMVSMITLFGLFAGLNTASAQYYYASPTVSTSTATNISGTYASLNGFVSSGGNINVNAWFEWGTNQYYFNKTNQMNYGMTNGTYYSHYLTGLSQNTTYYYRAAAQIMNGGIIYGNTMSFTTSGNSCGYSVCTSGAVTTAAINIGQSSARLNGLALLVNNAYTTGHFEWGTTRALGNITYTKNIGSAQSNLFYENLFDLASGVTYYYRAVVSNQYGNSYGDIMSFKTNAPVVPKNTAVAPKINNAGAVSEPSTVSLSINRNNETIRQGNSVEYTINYKNASSKDLRDAVLQVSIPKELKFMEASRGYFSEENNSVIANIGDLNSKEESNIRIRAQATNAAETGKIVVITANLAYTISGNNTQENIFAYAKNTIEEGVIAQGATAFLFGGSFFPNTLIGWAILLLLVVLLILTVRKAYYGPKMATIPAESHTKKTVK